MSPQFLLKMATIARRLQQKKTFILCITVVAIALALFGI
tara:strand:- start:1234 stop:1350 length:117 start_codon:yes stop_codon:yes gene_type:complete